MNLAVEMGGISKYFDGKAALEDVDFQVESGEIHCLLGENGAGKTTLMNVLFGLYRADKGYVKLYGDGVDIRNTGVAFRYGLGMVHQHFMLIENMTVLQNIILGYEIGNGKIHYGKNKEAVQKVMEQYGLSIDLDAKVKDLSVGMKQRTEIIKALYRGAEILVLDEPTAVLTPEESNNLMKVLKFLQKMGKTIIFITHKLKETMEIANRATILRNGKLVETVNVHDVTEKELALKMVGHSIPPISEQISFTEREVLFEVQHLTLQEQSPSTCSFALQEGEILGIAGVDGNGQLELEEMIMGLRPITNGEIVYRGQSIKGLSTLQIKNRGIGHIPSDRFYRAILPQMTLTENVFLGLQDHSIFVKRGLVQHASLAKYTADILAAFNVKYHTLAQHIAGLSGGNQQKVVVAREVSNGKEFILAAQPSRGLDIGATQFIHEQFRKIRNEKKAVLLISADLDEILEMSDRIAVLYNGEIMAVDETCRFTKERLGLLMAGKKEVS